MCCPAGQLVLEESRVVPLHGFETVPHEGPVLLEFLLVEIERVDEPQTAAGSASATELARQAAAAAKRLQERGIELAGEAPETPPTEEGNEEIADASDAEAGELPEVPNEQPRNGQAEKPETVAGPPPGTPSSHDDDIVARQLREAAERETDPELRAKLWREYRDYKEGRQPQ